MIGEKMVSNRAARGQQYGGNGINKIWIKKNSAKNKFGRFSPPTIYFRYYRKLLIRIKNISFMMIRPKG
jgi:hypothetical protein